MVNRQNLDALRCTETEHANMFNIDLNPKGELPMFCRCGEINFNDEDLDIDYQHENRWLYLIQDVT